MAQDARTNGNTAPKIVVDNDEASPMSTDPDRYGWQEAFRRVLADFSELKSAFRGVQRDVEHLRDTVTRLSDRVDDLTAEIRALIPYLEKREAVDASQTQKLQALDKRSRIHVFLGKTLQRTLFFVAIVVAHILVEHFFK